MHFFARGAVLLLEEAYRRRPQLLAPQHDGEVEAERRRQPAVTQRQRRRRRVHLHQWRHQKSSSQQVKSALGLILDSAPLSNPMQLSQAVCTRTPFRFAVNEALKQRTKRLTCYEGGSSGPNCCRDARRCPSLIHDNRGWSKVGPIRASSSPLFLTCDREVSQKKDVFVNP